ncbi:MAG TPA: hypothetical protein VFR86_09335 [Burkholderiaceae bacterium]|nr:hypothetical protein [Burkholderiaceae bacterium]
MLEQLPRAELSAHQLPPHVARIITLTALQWGLTKNEVLLQYLYGPVPTFADLARRPLTNRPHSGHRRDGGERTG